MTDILSPGVNCWRSAQVSDTGLLIDGSDYYRAFCQAAESAENYILLSGWQFDSDVKLLRESDADEQYTLIALLNRLCERNQNLRVYILAWNFSVLYSIDREWLQSWSFNWKTNERIEFCFDSCHPFGASHHQKFVVVDGRLAFLGGLDICSGRWDERQHCADDPRRVNSDQSSYAPFHDVQSYHVGPIAAQLAEFFKDQWRTVCGCELDLSSPATNTTIAFQNALPIRAKRAAVSRTQVRTTDTGNQSTREIRRLFRDAIRAAESLIYIENQYFSAQAVYEALVRRMSEPHRAKLEIILVLAKEANAFVEQASIGIAQAKIIRHLRHLADETGHAFGVYFPASRAANGEEAVTYIHSKLLLVDDSFLSVGSANLNNRSMGLDTELNVSWQALGGEAETIDSIRNIRVNLLSEHTGHVETAELARTKGLVHYLDELSDDSGSRLWRHPLLGTAAEQESWIATIFPDGLPLDPEGPVFGEDAYEKMPSGSDAFFPRGIQWLTNFLSRGIE